MYPQPTGNQLELYQAVDRTPENAAENLATQASRLMVLLNTETLITAPARNLEFYIRLAAGYALLDGSGANVVPTDGIAEIRDSDGVITSTEVTVDQRPQLHISDLDYCLLRYKRCSLGIGQQQ